MEKPTSAVLKSRGFALVVTLTLMILLTLIAVGLLSLSAVSMRTTSQAKAESDARANARMALMFAIGEIQNQLGPDQRVSASGAITDPDPLKVKHPHWTGVWNSWKAGTGEISQHSTIGSQPDSAMRPTYQTRRGDYFRSWLLSLSPAEATTVSSPLDVAITGLLMPGPYDPNTPNPPVELVGKGSLGKAAAAQDFVSARLHSVKSPTGTIPSGRYGWWVGDESQKARVMADSYAADSSSLTMAEKIFRSQTPGSMGNTAVAGLEGMTNEPQLDHIPSLKTLDLVSVNPAPAADDPAVSEGNFHHATTYSHGVLADVREGGLKRDLSTMLEREIKLSESSDEFMLYRFANNGEERVPIQDLAAYYQLYDNDPNWTSGKRGGIEHNPSASRVMQVKAPNYGDAANKNKFVREYTALYRNPVPVRVQFVLGVGATEITPTEKTAINASRASATPAQPPLRDSDKYKLLLGVKPVVSLWNPNNVPLVMGTDASQIMKVGFPPFALRWKKYRADGSPAEFQSNYVNLNYAISNESTHSDARARSLGPYIMQLQFAKNTPVEFQPGEVKMLSIPINAVNILESGGSSVFGNNPLYQADDFLPDGFYVTAKTAAPSGNDVVQFPNATGTFAAYQGFYMVFGENDMIDMEVVPEAQTPRSLAISNANEVRGSGFQFWMSDADYAQNAQTSHFRNYQFISRFGGTDQPTGSPNFQFNANLMLSGFPGGQMIPYEGNSNATPGIEIANATEKGEAKGLLLFTMMAGAELHITNSPGAGGGRRITTRPFLHGSTLSAPQMSNNTRSALYDYGWEWQVERINDVEEAFQDDGESRGYYGGGYTVGAGVTHAVQQYLPVLPPVSIASLSSAHLGGFGLANATVMSTPDKDVQVGGPASTDTLRDAPGAGDFRQVTATGQGGLAPHSLQAIGNSYAHPNIPANKAFTTYTQLLNTDTDASNPPQKTYADHSYLANKALWDEYFFSSITPQPNKIPLYGSGPSKPALDVANDFLFKEESLPNRRFIPYTANLNTDEFNALKTQYASYNNGFADKIASYLMVAGPFNINSTSVEAWKVLFSSLKGKPLAYLKDQASSLSTTTPENTPAGAAMLANGEPINGSDLNNDSNSPPEQWTSSRSLTDQEIDELSIAIVEQVRKRGPFLSLSEFINRRLENDPETALKGALQAALDDDSVSINAAFRTAERSLDGGDPGEIDGMTAAFPEALKGPIAYGSTPYCDQADILQHMGSILTPRGDTFVIRTYGDSLDAQGKVAARAWCEAIVQRTPDYVDGRDDAYLKNGDLVSEANKRFGRQFQIISFRWLNANEV